MSSSILAGTAANQAPKCDECRLSPALVSRGGWCLGCFGRKTTGLSDRQLGLLVRASESRWDLQLEREETSAAVGLERRGLGSTHRLTKPGFSLTPRYVKGAKRTLLLRAPGRAYVELMGDRAARHRKAPPATMDRDAAVAALRLLAEAILDDHEQGGNPSRYLINRARAVLESVAPLDAVT